jgi:hypothetical protein
MIVFYSEKPPQDQPLFDATAEVWPVHCWVASLLSMDSMTLAMSFMTFPYLRGAARCLSMWAFEDVSLENLCWVPEALSDKGTSR